MYTIVLIEPTWQELQVSSVGSWAQVISSGIAYFNICGEDCMVCLVCEPTNNLRGSWHAKMQIKDYLTRRDRPRNLESNWGHSRYYFDIENAVKEVEKWLLANEQIPET